MVEKNGQQSEKQDLELKRLKRIEKMIVVFTVLLAVATFLFKRPSFKAFDVLAGGVVAFVYFYLLTKTMYGAFRNADNEGEISFSPRMAIKISILSIVSVVFTLGLLIPKICLPIGYLIGFSSMFISILADGVFTGMFVTLKPKE
ncbi:MAG: hypothetical protein GWP07_07940 [Xanthomonadaceae bacterium]|nr:hypothetical protein [Xanthomonadaceae bacterium]